MKISVYLFDEADQPFFFTDKYSIVLLIGLQKLPSQTVHKCRKFVLRCSFKISVYSSNLSILLILFGSGQSILFRAVMNVPSFTFSSNVPSVGFSSVLLYIRFRSHGLLLLLYGKLVSITEQPLIKFSAALCGER